MARKMKAIRATAQEVQRSRRDWYAFHFENRAKAKALPDEQLRSYQMVANWTDPPKMTIFGGVPESYPDRQVYELANQYGLDVNLSNPWYLSDVGWVLFQKLWSELPEPVDVYSETVHTPCVQVGELYTFIHMPSEAEARI